MPPTSPGTAPSRRLPLALIVTVLSAAACADGHPVGVLDDPAVPPPSTVQALDCTVSLAGGMRCGQVAAGTGPARGAIFGGQNVYVTLASSNPSYDQGTEIFSIDVTVQNLLNEAIGTPDGSTPADDGIRVFFATGPTSVTGSVSVANEDGTAFFTDANQPFYRYPEVLAKDQVSAARTWQFSVEPSVTAFSFRVYVSTDVQYRLVINELLANPGGTISDASGEWFEIYNAGTFAVDLQGLVIADSAASGRRPFHLIASSVVVAPGGYVVLGNSTNTTNNGGVPVDYAYGSALAFANSLDALKISRVVGSDTLTLDRTQYASAAISAQNGISRELKNPALNNADMDGSNWADALVTAVYGEGGRGTPRAQNSTYTP
jgi:hypothetical protein